jgi:signal transduction histidine kinase
MVTWVSARSATLGVQAYTGAFLLTVLIIAILLRSPRPARGCFGMPVHWRRSPRRCTLRDRLQALASQHEGLRRVATLVARGGSQSEVVSSVAEEMARCLNVENADVFRYEDDGATIVAVATFAEPGVPDHTVGERLTTEGDNISSKVWRTERAARMDSWESAAGSIAERVRMLGLRSRVGAPIVVDERVWGMAVVGNSQPDPLPPDTEERVAEFADVAATAIAAAATHAELIASRARIVAAADDARRRFERDLHDGAQQRLVTLGLKVRAAMDHVPAGLDGLNAELSDVACGLTAVLEELRDISHGIHPAILSSGGLGAALNALARRSAVPVTLDVAIEADLPDSVEVAAYYVTAEALANSAKHAQASEVMVRVRTVDETLHLSIRDDGIGGADSRNGSGITGLKDRIDVLRGKVAVNSSVGSGTVIDVTIPLVMPRREFYEGP